MLSRHHGDGAGKQKEAESDVHLSGCQSWGINSSPLLASPVMLECSICSGPYISYALEETWQPRQRTQASVFKDCFHFVFSDSLLYNNTQWDTLKKLANKRWYDINKALKISTVLTIIVSL